ncbi:Na+/H+ antiporter NhaC family protein [Terrisporobacter mayombei]|uniref:Malate-2H(+)/Na(+)-lactate antiporter n=2 Tax=Terrisporobacter mayombei TaxID=1541 RepID=A0ABY9Q0Y5_9FIRM|nr:Na+/H+ antiporter NhaC family protein [Terrisporobacter mayombei]MCC3867002.1 Na+/H+ antiporter NhaC family protein [Terrisporobacter mayombei]WMT81256.1 Malate-2H(+)/Na(+)-lactate antiporter [Terrisporobacter mayombei]
MSIFLIIVITIIMLIFSVFNDIFLGYGLTISLILFSLIGLKRNKNIKDLLKLYAFESKRSFPIIQILLLISILISVWLSCGTIPAIVYYSLKYINPNLFILFCFLIPAITSFLIGTSFGTVSSIGIPLIIIAQASNINLNLVGGAIMSGAYLGDRCSPLSSSLLLLCNLTNVDLFNYVRKVFIFGIIPTVISVIFYLLFSFKNPLTFIDNSLSLTLHIDFHISFILLIPAIIIIILSLKKVSISKSITISIITSIIICFIIQKINIIDLFNYIIFGYEASSSLSNIIKGGGIISMLKTCYIIIVSCCLTGFFSGLNIFDGLKKYLKKIKLNRSKLFLSTLFLGLIIASIGCSQTIAFILTIEILRDTYEDYKNEDMAMEFSDSAIVTSALIPWCIAALVPTSVLGISSYKFIPYAIFLYIVPICHLCYCIYLDYYKDKSQKIFSKTKAFDK